MTITRTELAAHVEAAFTTSPATRDRLLAYAAGSNARPEITAALQALPDKPYPTIRDLWYELGHIPIGS